MSTTTASAVIVNVAAATKNDGTRAPSASEAANGGSTKKSEAEESFWRRHKEDLRHLLPYLWPKDQPLLKVMFTASVIFLLASKVANVASPIALKAAVDKIAKGENGYLQPILIYGALRFGANLCAELKDNCFAYVAAHASRGISLRVFTHVMDLSLRFHINRKTGAVIRACARGSESFANLLRYISFQIAPIFLEVGLVCAYLFSQYEWCFAVITVGVIAAYIGFTVPFAEWRNKFRREMVLADDAFNQKATDSLLNFETIKLFCAEPHISHTYDEALRSTQKATLKTTQSLAGLNLGQALIITVGITASLALAAKRVVEGKMTVGDFVLVNTYILQLYVPLNFLGTYYRMIKQCMVDVESMFKLLREHQEVEDLQDSKVLVLKSKADARVEFENVTFAYNPNERLILNRVSFIVEPGTKVALVGRSGAGKSTISKLIYRLYDIQGGVIRIAGQDIKRCTQRSVRLHIGIVPQDCVLFNDTIEYNIGFGKLGTGEVATTDEVTAAAEHAQFDDFVRRQPLGYNTLVGERGLRLSGGEKQRVAIARALLKNPPIMVYDEATSSLDTHTEKQIMVAINFAAQGRTNLVIAHRLSTVMDSDNILVLKEGEIVESGDHVTLHGKQRGLYRDMWEQQLNSKNSREDRVASAAALNGGAS